MPTLFQNEHVKLEYDRWLKAAPQSNDQPLEAGRYLSVYEALKAHFLIVDSFCGKGEGLGGVGPKDIGLLESALGRQLSTFDGKELFPDVFAKAATILHGITKNHPFHDANKRTAFLCSLHFLKKNSFIPTLDDKQYEDFVVHIADGAIRKRAKFKEFADLPQAEIEFIADFLRKATRQIDKRDYVVTFRELDHILRRFGFYFTTPVGNCVKVRRISDDSYVCEVGCPSMSKQVNKGAIKTIRQRTSLDALHNVDSQMFFREEETLPMLMAKYHDPLLRLADR